MILVWNLYSFRKNITALLFSATLSNKGCCYWLPLWTRGWLNWCEPEMHSLYIFPSQHSSAVFAVFRESYTMTTCCVLFYTVFSQTEDAIAISVRREILIGSSIVFLVHLWWSSAVMSFNTEAGQLTMTHTQ